ncbi:hypothetical protein GRJ2_003181000 [Grus japonensis]|uniref:ribonuclease H n=1 Tax=Grus japonensis TaxID=30415 RepID=A0ABC9YBZ4_GRUJA
MCSTPQPGENGPTWSLWQKAPGETRGRPLGFWSRGYRGSEARYTPTEKEILAACEGVRAASEVIGTEAQLLLAPRLPVLGWMFKERAPSTHHATDATWSKWVALITQRARIGNPNRPGILEVITDWPEGKDFGMSPEEEVTHAEEAPPYNKLTEDEKPYALFTDGSCRIVGKHRRWKAAVWSPTRRVAEAAEGEGESSQFAEVKAIQLALDIAEREKWPTLYVYTASWMVANALWGWLQQWKQSNCQHRGKPIWAAPLWQDIAARLEKLVVKVRHVDAHVPKSRATEEHQNNQQVDQAAKIEVAQVDLDWQCKGELFIARWARDTSGHQGRDATYRWARDRGVDLSMDAISQVIHQCETCAAIKQAKRVKPLWYGGRWLKYKYGEAWQIDYITLPQTRQGKRYVLTMVEATTGWLETYPVPHATARNTILGLEKQVLWRHGTPERIESDNGTHFRNNLIDTWAKEHGIEWVYHIPYHAPASGKTESPIWPVRKSNGEWRLTVDYRGLNEVTLPMSAAVPDMLELQYELESKAAKWYATIDIANALFSIPLAAECRPQFAFTWRGVQYTWNRLPQGWKHSPTISHGLIQSALEKGEAPEHLQYIDDIIVWGNSAEEVSEKGTKAGFTIKRNYLRRGYFKDPKGYQWAFGVATVNTEKIKQLSTLSGLSEDPFVVGLLQVKEQQVPIATRTVHRRQYRTNRDSLAPIHELIHQLENQGVISKTHSPFHSPIWPVQKSDGGWRLTVDYRGLNEVTPPLSAAVPDMLELQYELESKAAKWYATMDIANAFFSIPLAAECRPRFAFTWRGVQYTWNRLPQGWKHSPTICHGLIQTALEKGGAPEHLQYIDDIIVWGNKAEEVFKKGKRIIQILLKAGFAIKKSKVKGPAQEIQFLGIKWQDGRRHVPMDVVNKIAAMSPPANKKETQAFLGLVRFWRMHIPGYSQLVSPLYRVTRKKNYFEWGLEQQQAFEHIKQEIARAVALGPVRTGPAVQNVLYTAAGEHGLTWSLWQKTAGETRGRPLGFWSRGYRGSEAHYTPTEKEILAAYEGIRAASEVVGTEASLLLEPRLPVLRWMFKGNIPSTHHATSTTWNAHIPKSRATEEHRNNEQVDKAAKIEVAQVDLDWECKGELFVARWAHETSGHLGRDATYRWARDRGVDLTMEAITLVSHECEICAAIKRATRVKSPWNRGRWLGFRYGEAWQIDYIGPLP